MGEGERAEQSPFTSSTPSPFSVLDIMDPLPVKTTCTVGMSIAFF